MSEHLLTVADVAKRLGKSERWVKRAANAGTIGHVRIGRDLRFTEDDVQAFIQAAHRAPTPPDPAEVVARSHGRVTRRRSA